MITITDLYAIRIEKRMGTRTYSRRAVDGTRKPTLLGIRTGKFVGEVEQPPAFNPNSLSVYADKRIYNPDLLPAGVQAEIRKAYDWLDNLSEMSWSFTNNRVITPMMESLGLDINNPVDRRIFADLNGFFGSTTVTGSEFISNEYSSGYDVSFTSDSVRRGTRRLRVFPQTNKIFIENYLYSVEDDAPQGMGFSLIARQLAAAREIIRRTNFDVEIETEAVTDPSSTYAVMQTGSKVLIGTLVWPKMGYRGDLENMVMGGKNKGEIVNLLRQRGFDGDALKFTDALMMSTSKTTGESGYDAWNELMKDTNVFSSLRMSTAITSNDVRSGNLTLAEQVSQGYAKRKGFSKVMPHAQGDGTSWFTAQDDAILREVWQNIKNKNKR